MAEQINIKRTRTNGEIVLKHFIFKKTVSSIYNPSFRLRDNSVHVH